MGDWPYVAAVIHRAGVVQAWSGLRPASPIQHPLERPRYWLDCGDDGPSPEPRTPETHSKHRATALITSGWKVGRHLDEIWGEPASTWQTLTA